MRFLLPALVVLASASYRESESRVLLALNAECLSNPRLQRRRLEQLPYSLDQISLARNIVSRTPNVGRRLHSASSVDESLAALMTQIHLRTAEKLLGSDSMTEAMIWEKRGDVEAVLHLLGASADVRSLMSHKYGSRTQHSWEEAVPTPVLADYRWLSAAEVLIVDNPFLPKDDILEVVSDLTCVELAPQLDRERELTAADIEQSRLNKEAFHQALYGTPSVVRSLGKPIDWDNEPTHLTYSEAADVLEGQGHNVTLIRRGFYPGQIVDTDLWEMDEVATFAGPQDLGNIQFRLPNDPWIAKQWYIFGPAQGVPFGAGVIDAWALAHLILTNFQLPPSRILDITLLQNRAPRVPIVVIDSGCSANEDLIDGLALAPGCQRGDWGSKQFLRNWTPGRDDCVGINAADGSMDPRSMQSHGTETAALIGAVANNGLGMAGLCPMCRVKCAKIYDERRKTIADSGIVIAMDYAMRSGIRIVNLSVGGPGDAPVEQRVFRKAAEVDTQITVSAGNNGCFIDGMNCPDFPGQPFTPPQYYEPNTLVVCATGITGQRAKFSNYGPRSVDICAPGQNIKDFDAKGTPGGVSVDGTSFSAPIVCALLGILHSLFGQARILDLTTIIRRTVTPSSSLNQVVRYPGVVNFARAVAAGLKVFGPQSR